jgi:asparagine synthase (glutamine-hydrolysing)
MMVDAGGIRIEQYWDIRYREPRPPARTYSRLERDRDRERVEEFQSLFEESVRLRLIAEVPLGVFLSGGLDSSAVLATMSKITGGKRVKTFSVGYEPSGPAAAEIEEANEFSYARQAAAHFGADHHEFRMTAGDFRDAISLIASHLDEPMADPTCIPLYFISKLARNYITVVLSGEGADETMGGYTLYRRILALDKLRRRAGPLAAAFPALARLPLGDRVRAYLRRAGNNVDDHYRGVVKGLTLETRLALAGPERVRAADELMTGLFSQYFKRVSTASALNRMLYADAKVWLPEDLLLKADKMTMATAVELRVPFLDHKLVEYIAALPDSVKVRGGQGKWILRQAMGTVLPHSILHRRKKGFPIPAGAWFRFQLRDFVRDTLLARDSACREFFDPQAIEQIVSLQETGRLNGFQEVWSLLLFESWHKRFVRETAAAQSSGPSSAGVDVFAGRGA